MKVKTTNSTSTAFSYTFDCIKILFISVIGWNISLQPQAITTNIEGNKVTVKTNNNGGCYIYAILLV